MQELSNGTYLGNAYYPSPYLFDDVDYTSESDFLMVVRGLTGIHSLGSNLLINSYVRDG